MDTLYKEFPVDSLGEYPMGSVFTYSEGGLILHGEVVGHVLCPSPRVFVEFEWRGQ